MKRLILRGLAVLIVLMLAVALVKREEITRLMAVQTLFDADRIVGNFSHMDDLFRSVTLSRGPGPVSPLSQGPALALPAEAQAWIKARNITALVVLSDGEIVHEAYFQGTGPEDRRISWSMAKSWLSALLGTLIADGTIGSLDDPVTEYVPSLIGTAYDGATIRNVAHMASGVAFDEDYLDPRSDINRMGRVIALGGSLDGFTESLKDRQATPGAEWLYVSMDTHVLGMVIRAATGQSAATLMQERIIAPLGLEADPYYLTDGDGVAFVLGGLNMRTRDYARFGQMIAQGGMWQGKQVVPADWIDLSTAATAPDGPTPGGAKYGLQWWLPAVPRPGEVFAIGVYGQYTWIDRSRNVVIAVNAADREFMSDTVFADNITLLRSLTEAAYEARTD